jgi:hypothetical protein
VPGGGLEGAYGGQGRQVAHFQMKLFQLSVEKVSFVSPEIRTYITFQQERRETGRP